MSDTIIIDTPAGIAMFALLQLAHALALEINTGMKMGRGSLVKVATARGLTDQRTKKGALRDVIAHIQQVNPEFVVDERTLGRALAA